MPLLKTFSKSEDASACAAYLSAMGLHPFVIDDGGFGGNLFGTTSAGSIRVEVPESELEEAARQMETFHVSSAQQVEAAEATADVSDQHWGLAFFYHACLAVWSITCILAFYVPEIFYVIPTPEVQSFLDGVRVSKKMETLAEITMEPLVFLTAGSALLCAFYVRIGRVLYTFAFCWSLMLLLGLHPGIVFPRASFFFGLVGSLSTIALALMYWSPLAKKFEQCPPPANDARDAVS